MAIPYFFGVDKTVSIWYCNKMGDSMKSSLSDGIYDVIVIGGGLGGLTCAAVLANRGYNVALFEQHSNVGGYASRFCRRAPDGDIFRFEASIHAIAGCGENGAIRQALREVGAEEDVEFLDLGHSNMKIVLSDRVIDLSYRQEAFIDMLTLQFPEERQNIERFFCDLNYLWDILPDTQAKPLFQEPPANFDMELKKRLVQPLSSVLSTYFADQRIFLYIYIPISYCGLELSEIDFMKYAVSMREFFRENSYWVRGGSQSLSDAFAKAIARQGGDVRTDSLVKRILVDEGGAVGVMLEDGGRYHSDFVVSNADATSTFLNMVGQENLPADFVTALTNMTATWSAFQVFLGLDEGFVIPEAFSSSFEICIMNKSQDQVRKYPFVGITNYTLLDPSLAPNNKQIITIGVPMQMGDLKKDWGVSTYDERNEEYRTRKEKIADELITIAEGIYPGLQEHILVKEAATPLTFQRYTLNKNGSYLGFDIRYKRLPQKTPLEGLYLAGGWTEPHAGVMGVIISGKQAAEMIHQRSDTSS